MGKILLFYKYVYIENPDTVVAIQKELCQRLGLRGRILIAHEGINGTVGGTAKATEEYVDAMRQISLFASIDFKESEGGAQNFPRLCVKRRHEIVALGIDPTVLTSKEGGEHISVDQAHTLLEAHPDNLVVLDARNAYESCIGKFEGSITPPIKTFRELPAYIDENLELFKDKQVLMCCTGGIRCERASAYLKQKGIAAQVYQLSGGIHRYLEAYPQGFFKGKNYVFDSRVGLRVNDEVVSVCTMCAEPCDAYSNCLNALCNKQFITCNNCKVSYKGACSTVCSELLSKGDVPQRPVFKQEHV